MTDKEICMTRAEAAAAMQQAFDAGEPVPRLMLKAAQLLGKKERPGGLIVILDRGPLTGSSPHLQCLPVRQRSHALQAQTGKTLSLQACRIALLLTDALAPQLGALAAHYCKTLKGHSLAVLVEVHTVLDMQEYPPELPPLAVDGFQPQEIYIADTWSVRGYRTIKNEWPALPASFPSVLEQLGAFQSE